MVNTIPELKINNIISSAIQLSSVCYIHGTMVNTIPELKI